MAYDKKKMDVNSDESRELVNIIGSYIDDSLGFISTETSLSRQKVLNFT